MEYLELSNGVAISKSALATIVYYAVKENEHTSIFHLKHESITERKLAQIVKLDTNDYGLVINLNLELCYGADLEAICKDIQNNVMDVLEQSLGFKPACVNIDVSKINVC